MKQLFSSRKDMLLMAASGVFLTLHFYTWVLSLTRTSIFGSTVLVSAHPVFTIIGDKLLFRQRYKKSALIGTAVSLLGIVLVGGNSLLTHEGNIAGDLLALLGAMMFSAYMLVGHELRSRYSINTYTTGVYGFSALILALLGFSTGLQFTAWPVQSFVYVGVVVVAATLLGHSIVNWSLGHLPPSTVSILLLMSPLLTGIWSYILLPDHPVPSAFLAVGGLVTVIGMAWYLSSQFHAVRLASKEMRL